MSSLKLLDNLIDGFSSKKMGNNNNGNTPEKKEDETDYFGMFNEISHKLKLGMPKHFDIEKIKHKGSITPDTLKARVSFRMDKKELESQLKFLQEARRNQYIQREAERKFIDQLDKNKIKEIRNSIDNIKNYVTTENISYRKMVRNTDDTLGKIKTIDELKQKVPVPQQNVSEYDLSKYFFVEYYECAKNGVLRFGISKNDDLDRLVAQEKVNYVGYKKEYNTSTQSIGKSKSSKKITNEQEMLLKQEAREDVLQNIIHHSLERFLLTKAVTYLLDNKEIKTVLVDVLNRKQGLIDQQKLEIHTVLLYKYSLKIKEKYDKKVGIVKSKEKDEKDDEKSYVDDEKSYVVEKENDKKVDKYNVIVIDPNNSQFSDHLKFLEIQHKLLNSLQTVISVDPIKIYCSSENSSKGRDFDQYRDCIDIAVKLAFGFNSSEINTSDLVKNPTNIYYKDITKMISNNYDGTKESSEGKQSIEEKKSSYYGIINYKLDTDGNLKKIDIPLTNVHINQPVRIKQTSNINYVKSFCKLEESIDNRLSIFNDLLKKLSRKKTISILDNESDNIDNQWQSVSLGTKGEESKVILQELSNINVISGKLLKSTIDAIDQELSGHVREQVGDLL